MVVDQKELPGRPFVPAMTDRQYHIVCEAGGCQRGSYLYGITQSRDRRLAQSRNMELDSWIHLCNILEYDYFEPC
jgi:hypothetical protein